MCCCHMSGKDKPLGMPQRLKLNIIEVIEVENFCLSPWPLIYIYFMFNIGRHLEFIMLTT